MCQEFDHNSLAYVDGFCDSQVVSHQNISQAWVWLASRTDEIDTAMGSKDNYFLKNKQFLL